MKIPREIQEGFRKYLNFSQYILSNFEVEKDKEDNW